MMLLFSSAAAQRQLIEVFAEIIIRLRLHCFGGALTCKIFSKRYLLTSSSYMSSNKVHRRLAEGCSPIGTIYSKSLVSYLFCVRYESPDMIRLIFIHSIVECKKSKTCNKKMWRAIIIIFSAHLAGRTTSYRQTTGAYVPLS